LLFFWSFDFCLLSKQCFTFFIQLQTENGIKTLFQYHTNSNALSKIDNHSPSSYSQSYRIPYQINRRQNRFLSWSIEYLRATTNGNLIRHECFDFNLDFVFHQITSAMWTSPAMFLEMIFKSWIDIQYSIFVSSIELSIILGYLISERNISSESWSLQTKSICQNYSSHFRCNEENDSINSKIWKAFSFSLQSLFLCFIFLTLVSCEIELMKSCVRHFHRFTEVQLLITSNSVWSSEFQISRMFKKYFQYPSTDFVLSSCHISSHETNIWERLDLDFDLTFWGC
jgi:hypothetical protein